MGHLGRLGVAMPFDMAIEQDSREATRYAPQIAQGGLGLPDRDYYLITDDQKFKAARQSYEAYLRRLFELSHAPGAAAANAQAVIGLETALAEGQWTRVANRDPVKTYTKVDSRAWSRSRRISTGPPGSLRPGLAGKASDVIVHQPSYLGTVDAQIVATPLATWKAYLPARLLDSYAPYLSKASPMRTSLMPARR